MLLASLAFFVWYAVFAETRAEARVYFFDVGQGDSIFIQAENGSQVLIDGGPDDAVLARLGEVLPFYDRAIDIIILTHSDADHINGLVEVAKRYSVGLALESGVASSSAAYIEFRSLLSKQNTPVVSAVYGQKIYLDNNFVLSVVAPWEKGGGAAVKTNNASIVARLDYGEASFLFTGDIEAATERKLSFLSGSELDVDILKVAHHGSKTSSIEEFLKVASPQAAIISAGKNNRYGHPNPEVVSRIHSHGVQIRRTDLEGTIVYDLVNKANVR